MNIKGTLYLPPSISKENPSLTTNKEVPRTPPLLTPSHLIPDDRAVLELLTLTEHLSAGVLLVVRLDPVQVELLPTAVLGEVVHPGKLEQRTNDEHVAHDDEPV